MDDDFDIYEDLPITYDIKDNGTSSGNNENISKECEELKRELTELTSKLQKLQKTNETLEVNLSSLLKTAKAEIARKDKMIDELRRQVDDMSFKRGYYNRNKREINGKAVSQMPTPNTQELNNIQVECTKNLTIENMTRDKTMSSSNQFGQDQDALDYESFHSKRYEAKYRTKNVKELSKQSNTVFTERLRKRIIEEEAEAEQQRKLEEQEKQNLPVENNYENNRDINIDNKENQSHFSIWNSNVDNTYSWCQGTDHDYIDNINSPEDAAVYIENQQRLVKSTKVSGKRIDSDADVPYNKRRKLETEQNGCTSKDSLPRKEDVFNGYDDEIILHTSINKFDYKEDINISIERNEPHCKSPYDRDHSRSKSNDGYYKRKEHYKKSSNDYNYSKESTYYHEKDKYNRTRNRSPVLRYSDRKHKYHDDRYKDHRDKFDKRRNFHDKEEETSIIPNKKFYDLRHIDKIKSNGKYNSTDFYLPRHKESKYSDSRISRSVPHERSKSGSRERTNHNIYDRKSSKFTKTNDGSEKHVSSSLKKRDEKKELKATNISKKKDHISEKSVKRKSIEPLDSSAIIVKSPIKSSINKENKKVENVTRESINIENKSEKELVSSKPEDAPTANSRTIKDENSRNIEYEKNENNDKVKKVEDIMEGIITKVNIRPGTTHIPLDEKKQDCTVTSVDTITEKKSKCDEHIVQDQTADKEAVNTCNNIQNFPRDVVSNIVVEISAEARHENNTNDKHNAGAEELKVCNKLDIVRSNSFPNEIDNKHSLPKNSLESQTSTSNDLGKVSTVKSEQKTEQDNNGSDHVKSKESESKKKSVEHEKSKIIVVARRRKRVQLADTNASMTIVITANSSNTDTDTDLKNNTENNLKSRACKVSRSYKNVM